MKWNASSRAAPATMKTPRSTSAITIPIESSGPCRCSGIANVREDEREDEDVVDREAALDQVAGQVLARARPAVRWGTTTSVKPMPSASQPMLQISEPRKVIPLRPKRKKSTASSASTAATKNDPEAGADVHRAEDT